MTSKTVGVLMDSYMHEYMHSLYAYMHASVHPFVRPSITLIWQAIISRTVLSIRVRHNTPEVILSCTVCIRRAITFEGDSSLTERKLVLTTGDQFQTLYRRFCIRQREGQSTQKSQVFYSLQRISNEA